LPAFITAPGETDPFMVGAAIFLVIAVLALGSVYFRLHSLPEKLAHGKTFSKVQFELVAVLALLALFTHNNWFWVASLVLALVPIPDMHGPLQTMADALTRMAGPRRAPPEATEPTADNDTTPSVMPEAQPASAPAAASEPVASQRSGDEAHA